MKKVSVVIPAYNMADLTARTVESVLNQTYADVEIIVVDDGSTDGTREKMRSFGDAVKYVYKENGGASSARNLGIKLSKGEYTALLDCDDVYAPDKIEKSVRFLEENPGYGFVHSAANIVDENGKVLEYFSMGEKSGTGWIAESLILRNFICNSTVVARRECFSGAGFFDESIFIPADWDMWLRLSEKYRAGFIDEPLTMYLRRTKGSYTHRHLENALKHQKIVLEKFFKRNPGLVKRLKNKAYSGIFFCHAGECARAGDTLRAVKAALLSVLLERSRAGQICAKWFRRTRQGRGERRSS
ncbi:MAG: glycosyltransferase [Candidatus Omnitrophota bacterium]